MIYTLLEKASIFNEYKEFYTPEERKIIINSLKQDLDGSCVLA